MANEPAPISCHTLWITCNWGKRGIELGLGLGFRVAYPAHAHPHPTHAHPHPTHGQERHWIDPQTKSTTPLSCAIKKVPAKPHCRQNAATWRMNQHWYLLIRFALHATGAREALNSSTNQICHTTVPCKKRRFLPNLIVFRQNAATWRMNQHWYLLTHFAIHATGWGKRGVELIHKPNLSYVQARRFLLNPFVDKMLQHGEWTNTDIFSYALHYMQLGQDRHWIDPQTKYATPLSCAIKKVPAAHFHDIFWWYMTATVMRPCNTVAHAWSMGHVWSWHDDLPRHKVCTRSCLAGTNCCKQRTCVNSANLSLHGVVEETSL